MTRKRKKPGAPESEVIAEAVPEDILAEGSGPVTAVAHVAMPTDDQEPDPPPRTKRSIGRKPKRSSRDATSDMIEAVADELVAQAHEVEVTEDVDAVVRAELAAADAEPEAKPARRRKRTRVVDDVPVTGETGERAAVEAAAEGESIEGEAVEAAAEGESADESIEGEALEASTEGESAESIEGEDGASAEGDEAGAEGGVDASPNNPEGVEGAVSAAAEGEAIEGEVASGEAVEGVAVLPTSAVELDANGLKQLVEALVFASDKPMTVQRLRQLTRVSDIPRLEAALAELATDYADRGIVLQQVSGGYQFRTRTQWSQWVQQLIAGRPVRLTRAQLETLAIIAYRQPITRPEIDDIRGVDSSATLKLLIDRQLIRILGKKEEAGRPMLYGTTKEFLDFFSLGDLRELPTLREYSELTAESRQVITDRLGDLPEGGEGEGGGGTSGDGGIGGGGEGGGGNGGESGDDATAAAEEPTAAELIARYVAELDVDDVPAREIPVLEIIDGDASKLDAAAVSTFEMAGEAAEPALIADDAAALADAILAMDPALSSGPGHGDAASPDANLAAAALANDAEELADAILATGPGFGDLAFDLSDAVGDDAQIIEVTAGSLAELDPFAAPIDGRDATESLDSLATRVAAWMADSVETQTTEPGGAVDSIEARAVDALETQAAVESQDALVPREATESLDSLAARVAAGKIGAADAVDSLGASEAVADSCNARDADSLETPVAGEAVADSRDASDGADSGNSRDGAGSLDLLATRLAVGMSDKAEAVDSLEVRDEPGGSIEARDVADDAAEVSGAVDSLELPDATGTGEPIESRDAVESVDSLETHAAAEAVGVIDSREVRDATETDEPIEARDALESVETHEVAEAFGAIDALEIRGAPETGEPSDVRARDPRDANDARDAVETHDAAGAVGAIDSLEVCDTTETDESLEAHDAVTSIDVDDSLETHLAAASDSLETRRAAEVVEVDSNETHDAAATTAEVDPLEARHVAEAIDIGEAREAGEVGESISLDDAIHGDDDDGLPTDDHSEAAILAEGSGGIAAHDSTIASTLATASPNVGLDEWPGGSGGFAAANESSDAGPALDAAGELTARDPALGDHAAVDDAVDPVE